MFLPSWNVPSLLELSFLPSFPGSFLPSYLPFSNAPFFLPSFLRTLLPSYLPSFPKKDNLPLFLQKMAATVLKLQEALDAEVLPSFLPFLSSLAAFLP
jgi:hypothetical protein